MPDSPDARDPIRQEKSPTSATASPIPLYEDYFVGDYKAEWYAVGSIAKAKNVLELCRGRSFRVVADVGAGNGAVTERLRDGGLAPEIVALEISESGLKALAERFQGGSVRPIRFDGRHVPFPPDSFDLAVLSHVVEHLEHPRLLLHEVRRVARMLYVEVPLEHRAFRRILESEWVPDETGHINYFDFATAKRLLETSGWRVVASATRNPAREAFQFASGRTRGSIHWLVREVLLRIAPRIARAMFCYHGCYLCERSPTVGEALR